MWQAKEMKRMEYWKERQSYSDPAGHRGQAGVTKDLLALRSLSKKKDSA